MKKEKRAFTLAEVLITLTIIGVIAAITVPALIQRTNKQEYVTALQKAYSTLSQATNMIIAENGSPKSSCSTCDDGWAYSLDNIYKNFKNHLNNSRDCGGEKGCFEQGNYKQLNGGKDWANWNTLGNRKKLILSDGMQILFQHDSGECLGNSYFVNDYGSRDVCAVIYSDINGMKKPNQIGRDVFAFVIKEQGLFPAGCDNSSKCSGIGWGCACKVLREGAMNY